MKNARSAILVGTHFLALGAGWWAVRDSVADPDQAPALAGKTERPPRQDRRVGNAGLLAAYGHSDFWMESQKRPSAATGEAPVGGASPVFIPAGQRAAEIADIPGTLQQELESVNAGKAYDYQLAKAPILRWIAKDSGYRAEIVAAISEECRRRGLEDWFAEPAGE